MAIEPQPVIARREVLTAQLLIFLPALALLGIFFAAWATGSTALHIAFVVWYALVVVSTTSVVLVRRRRIRGMDAQWALRFQQLALRDDLTGLHNRRYFDIDLGQSIDAARDAGEPLSLVLVDLNDFKSINDTLGHAAGDAAIRLAAAAIAAAAGPGATVARLGGDEFAALLPGAGVHEANAFRTRLRAAFEARPFTFEGSAPLRISAATGAATLLQGQGAEDLLRAADRALYENKTPPAALPALLRPAG